MKTILYLLAVVWPACCQFKDLARLQDYGAYRSSSNNPDLNSNDDSRRPIPGETTVLADLTGPGEISHIWLTVAANEYGWPRLLRFRVYYDGSATPSVDAPLGDFFAVGHGMERPVNSLVVHDGSSGRSRNSYWPMPFRKSCRITITNEGRRRVSNLYYHVDWRKLRALPADALYFHARYHQELPARMAKMYTLLDVRGRGHYVGTVLSVIQREAGWFGEGDDYFFIDGEKKARIEGTGTEDYFNDAWSLRVADAPYTGVSIADGTGIGSRMSAYRWHVPDPIPFTRSLKFQMEHAGWTYNANGSVRSAFEERADLFSSVAFWYQQGIAEGMPEVPYGAARLPHGNARQIEVEELLPQVRTVGGRASVQKEVFWSRDLLFFDAAGPGSRIEIPFEVGERGRYELVAQIAHSPDYGNYRALLDGKPVMSAGELEHEPGANAGGADTINLWHSEIYVAEDHMLGWPMLEPGSHRIAFECVGKSQQSTGYRLGIDTLIVARVAGDGPIVPAAAETAELARIQAMQELTLIGHAAARSLGILQKALSDESPIVRGLATLALRNAAPESKVALPRLIELLRDPDPNVRLMSAQAIGAQKAAAAGAVDALIAACRVAGEQVHVQRSLAAALGDIGPAAAAALPELRMLREIPRVRWPAEAAIRNIERGAR